MIVGPFIPQQIKYAPLGSRNANGGKPVFAGDDEVELVAHIEPSNKRFTKGDGEEKYASAFLIIDSPDIAISEQGQITLPDGTSHQVIQSDPVTDPFITGGVDHYEVFV